MTTRAERARLGAAWRARRAAELIDHMILIGGLVDELTQDGQWSPETGRAIVGHLDDLARDAGLSDAYAQRRSA